MMPPRLVMEVILFLDTISCFCGTVQSRVSVSRRYISGHLGCDWPRAERAVLSVVFHWLYCSEPFALKQCHS